MAEWELRFCQALFSNKVVQSFIPEGPKNCSLGYGQTSTPALGQAAMMPDLVLYEKVEIISRSLLYQNRRVAIAKINSTNKGVEEACLNALH